MDIQVLIPSIYRTTLFRAIDSVLNTDPEAKVLVLTSGPSIPEDFDMDQFWSYAKNPRVEFLNRLERKSAGEAKNILVHHATSDWFMILDDDDELSPNYLKSCRSVFEKYDGEFDWIHPKTLVPGSDTEYPPVAFHCWNLDNFHNIIFEYDKFKSYPDYYIKHIYPDSALMMRREKFLAQEEQFHLAYNDDTLPTYSYIMDNPRGIYMGTTGVYYSRPESSVSRREADMEVVKEFLKELAIRTVKDYDNSLKRAIWNKVYNNVIGRLNTTNGRSFKCEV